MRPDGRVLVLTSCTATKLERQGSRAFTAESLYRGQQHLRLLRGVKVYKDAKQPQGQLMLRIVSAGHGVLAASKMLQPYEQTFSGLPRTVIRERAHALAIPKQVATLLARPYNLALLLLGDDYLEACALSEEMILGGPTIAFCGPRAALKLPNLERLRTVPLHNPEAKRFSCGLVSLKGELGARILRGLAADGEASSSFIAPDADLLELLEAEETLAEGEAIEN